MKMKKNLKENKGITLIALIITIIVLLILAVVTISAVNEGNIFAHANNAVTRYNVAATEENTMISNYLTEMEKYDRDLQKISGGEIDEIIGTWIMTDGDYTDILAFNNEGTLMRTEKGKTYTGTWTKVNNTYNIVVNYEGESTDEFTMNINESGNLVYYGDSDSPEYIKS